MVNNAKHFLETKMRKLNNYQEYYGSYNVELILFWTLDFLEDHDLLDKLNDCQKFYDFVLTTVKENYDRCLVSEEYTPNGEMCNLICKQIENMF